MRKVIIILLSSFVSLALTQEADFWQVLSDVSFESKSKDNMEMDSPRFGTRLQRMNGKKIVLKGYLIPMSEFGGKDQYMLSSLPFNTCFFCGSAGPETIVELQTKQSVKFISERIIIEGTLVLNGDDPEHHMYILKEATQLD